MDLPNRTTRDYKAPTMMSSLQAALDAALQEEEEMVFDAMYVYRSRPTRCPEEKKNACLKLFGLGLTTCSQLRIHSIKMSQFLVLKL